MEYYVNYGRWNDKIVGPFESKDVACEYAAQHNMSSAPMVVTVTEPDPCKLLIAEDRCKRTFYVTLVREYVGLTPIELVILATSDKAARQEAIRQMKRVAGVSEGSLSPFTITDSREI